MVRLQRHYELKFGSAFQDSNISNEQVDQDWRYQNGGKRSEAQSLEEALTEKPQNLGKSTSMHEGET